MHMITDLIDSDSCFAPLRAPSKRAVLQILGQSLTRSAQKLGCAIGKNDIYESLLERDGLGPTGIGDGVAIPHARIPLLTHPLGAIAVLDAPVDFGSPDQVGCDIVLALISPASSGSEHLRALARLARVARDPGMRDKLRKAQSREMLVSALDLSQTIAA